MAFKFKVVKSDNIDWKKHLESCIDYDFYHTLAYHRIEEGEDSSLLFVAYDGANTIALPLIIRNIPDTDWKDATSVYGYAGPVASSTLISLDKKLVEFFKKELKLYFVENHIVSVFSRLHPLVESSASFFEDFGVCQNLNKTVSIDLTLSPEEQRRAYRKSNKYEINQLKKKGFTINKSTTSDELEEFIKIYNETMDRVNAASRYYFDAKYYDEFLYNNDFKSILLLAKKDDEVCAGAIFTITDSIMQYHLAGTKEEYIKDTPMKLILDEARLLGNDLGLNNLHLGGGVGGNDDDSLFRFKSGFSKNFKQFSVWKMIVDQKKYDLLSKGKNMSAPNDFFPLYRKY